MIPHRRPSFGWPPPISEADREPAGFNVNTSKDTSSAAVEVVDRIWPTVFHQRPDFTLSLDKELMVSADLTTQRPQTVVYKINPNANWADGVPITADDFAKLSRAVRLTLDREARADEALRALRAGNPRQRSAISLNSAIIRASGKKVPINQILI